MNNYKQFSQLKDYFQLSKPGVMSLVVFSTASTMYIAPGSIHPAIAFAAIISVCLGASASAAINMWYEKDIDSSMKRTQNRPVASGNIESSEALIFGIVLGTLGCVIMGVCVNYLSSLLLLLTMLFYTVVYTTILKPLTDQNIVIGGISGSIPPIIGWTSVTNEISYQAVVIGLLIFFWTPPHFWSLCLYRLKEYEKTKIPMMPVTRGGGVVKSYMIVYSIMTVLTSMIMIYNCGIFYGCIAGILGCKFIRDCFMLTKDTKASSLIKYFRYSILYLFCILVSIMIFYTK